MSSNWYCNGVNALDGSYLEPPGSLEDIATMLLEGPLAKGLELGQEYLNMADLTPVDDADADDLAETGWCVIFPEGGDPAIREALGPLLRLREMEANQRFVGYREFTGDLSFRRGDTSDTFMQRWSVGRNGIAQPQTMPYYVLLVGGPEEIPYDFQCALSLSHAVGRVHFEDVDDYARYAQSVVAADRLRRDLRLAVFGVQNNDLATEVMARSLVRPILDRFAAQHLGSKVEEILAAEATRQRLMSVLHEAPPLLFTASHGLSLPANHPRQEAEQGAIVCSDWAGNQGDGIGRRHCVSALDLPTGLDLAGLIWFQFACFSAGTPSENDFENLAEPWVLPTSPFVSMLAKKAMCQRDGRGAQALIGHVDRIWICSFFDEKESRDEAIVFQQVLSRLLRGRRVGYAHEHIVRWHASNAVRLSALLLRSIQRKEVDRSLIARTWLVSNDSRNYVILGDPAARLFPQEA